MFKRYQYIFISLAYLGVIIIWSTTPLAIKWSGEGTGFLFGVFSRMIIGAVLALILTMLIYQRIDLSTAAMQTYVASAIAIYGAMSAVYWGAQFIPSGLVSVVFGSSPFLVSLLAAIYLQEKSLSPSKVFGMILGFSGLLIVFHDQHQLGGSAMLGIAAVLMSVVVHSGSAVIIKRIDADISALMLTCGGLLLSLPLFAITFVLSGESWPELVPDRTGYSILYLGTVGSVFGFVLYYFILDRMSASSVAMVTMLTPVFALLIGSKINHESISGLVWMGTFLVITGLIVHQSPSFARAK